jgi:hypothetical protein
MNYWYFQFKTGTSGGWWRKAQFGMKMNYRYYRSLTSTTGGDRYYQWSLTRSIDRYLFRI